MTAGGEAAGVPVRDAATVMLLRDHADGLQVWLLTRVAQMAFAAGMSVFPGGGVDPDDAGLPFAGPLDRLAGRLDCPEPLARTLLGAAVRETFEEAGVLLTTPWMPPPPDQADVEAGRIGFGALLRRHGLVIEPDALRPWARWITPPGETSRRYDTRFFVGRLPDGAEAADVTSESSTAGWVGVAAAIEQGRARERLFMPPTIVTLSQLAGCATVDEALAAAEGRDLSPVLPRMSVRPDGEREVELPDGSVLIVPARGYRPAERGAAS